jgi:hypothetical protein
MIRRLPSVLVTFLVFVWSLAYADTLLINTIPSGPLFLQPPVATGAGSFFGNEGLVLADAFISPIDAAVDEIRVVAQYVPFLAPGTSPLSLSLLSDTGNSPGSVLESYVGALDLSNPDLQIVTVESVSHPLLESGRQYWLSFTPVDPINTAIGWGLASADYPGIQLPIAGNTTGTNSGWGPTTMNLANEFSVSGTSPVPEPSTWALLSIALLAISFHRHKSYRD